MTRTRGLLAAALASLLAAATLLSPGCQRTPRSLARATAADNTLTAPQALQGRPAFPRKAFTISDQQTWEWFWGQGAPAPKVDFEKAFVLGVFTSMASEGPGTLEITIAKYRRTKTGLDVTVRELLNGEWPQGVGFARAYDLAVLPKVQGSVRVLWQYKWGGRNELRQERPEDWNRVGQSGAQVAPGSRDWKVQQPVSPLGSQQPKGGWGNIRQPR